MKQEVLNRTHHIMGMLAGLWIGQAVAGAAAWGLPPAFELLPNQERLEIVVKKSAIVRLQQPASRVSIVAPEIADVQILDPKQLLVTAQSAGETTLIIWAEDNTTRMIDVCVRWNTRMIEETLRSTMPDEAIQVLPMQDGVILQGDVRGIGSADNAMNIANSLAPKVVNLLNVPGVHQVLLKVRVAEVARSFQKEMGVNFQYLDTHVQGANLLGGLVSGTINEGELSISDAVSLFLGFPGADISMFVQAMEEKGVLRLLAEPNLVARSGETATFLAGGEFPIPVVQGGGFSNAVTIEYKEYGVRLSFTPTVLSERVIRLDISPEVSDLDFSQGIKIGGFVVPTVVTRRVHTVVSLENGQSFAIAGLISSNKQKNRRKIPMIGDIPMLGGLFRGGELSEKETELLVLVTPNLVAPLGQADTYPIPGNYLEEPGKSPFLEDDGWKANPFTQEKKGEAAGPEESMKPLEPAENHPVSESPSTELQSSELKPAAVKSPEFKAPEMGKSSELLKSGEAPVPVVPAGEGQPAGGRRAVKTLSPDEVRPVITPSPPGRGAHPARSAEEPSAPPVEPAPPAQTSAVKPVVKPAAALEAAPAPKSLPSPEPAAPPKPEPGKAKTPKAGESHDSSDKSMEMHDEGAPAVSRGVAEPEAVPPMEEVEIASASLQPVAVTYTVTRTAWIPPEAVGGVVDMYSKPGFYSQGSPSARAPRYEITSAGLMPIKPGFQLTTEASPAVEPYGRPGAPARPWSGMRLDWTPGIAIRKP
ncbi:MAG: pilus assembly protein N-terminal domain-containing protein [bacterium]